jgi:hypothetical protein
LSASSPFKQSVPHAVKQEGAVIKVTKTICVYASLPSKAFYVCALQSFCGVSFSGYPFLVLLFSIY